MNLFLDIESIPGQGLAVKAAVLQEIEAAKAELRAPSNYKDPAKIAEYITAKHAELDAQADETWRKTSLDGARGEIICLAWAMENDPVDGVSRDFKSVGSEKPMLQDFFDALTQARAGNNGRAPCFIGHNVKDFDLRFVYHRAVILGVKPPCHLPHDARGNNEMVFDTMLAWAGWGNRIKLDTLCRVMGLPGKPDGIDGSRVWDFVNTGRIAEVMDYCKNDVAITREVYKRMMFLDG